MTPNALHFQETNLKMLGCFVASITVTILISRPGKASVTRGLKDL